MQLVRAGLQIDVDDDAGAAAVLGVIAVGQHGHFADGFHGRPDRVGRLVQEVDGVDVVVHAVEQEVVLSIAADAVSGNAAVVGIARAGFGRNHAGGEARQIGKVALAAERDIGECFGIDGRAHLGAFGLEQRRGGGDFDGLPDVANGKRNVDTGAFAGGQKDAFLGRSLEAGGGDGQVIRGRLQGGAGKLTGPVGGHIVFLTGRDFRDGHFGTGDHAAGGIGDGARDGCKIALRKHCGRADKSEQSGCLPCETTAHNTPSPALQVWNCLGW